MGINIDEFYASDYLKAADIGNRIIQVVIDNTTLETMNDGKQKPVIWFRNAKRGLVCNATNAREIARVHGPQTDNWPGKAIELFTMTVNGPNGTGPGIRVRAILDKQPESAIKADFDLAAEEKALPF